MKIMTFNLQNNIFSESIDKGEKLVNFIKKEDIDIIGVQELTYDLKLFLENNLTDYYILGDSRYGNNKRLDEYNCILVKRKYKVLKCETFNLYYRRKHENFSVFPRICTFVNIDIDSKHLYIFNTHIDHLFNYTKGKQIEYLNSIINRYSDGFRVIMGDFNMNVNNKYFSNILSNNLYDACEMLHENTFKKWGKLPIDHIFLSKNISFSSIKLIRNINISDHLPVILDIDFKE